MWPKALIPDHQSDALSRHTLSPGSPSEARTEYERRLQDREVMAAHLQRRHLWLGNARIAVFVAIVILAWFSRTRSLLFYLMVAAIVVFIVLVAVHREVVRAMNAARRAAGVYHRGLARIDDRWAGAGDTGDEFKDPLHLYAEDLDILGPGSLFQLLSTARTRMGRGCLARWLLAPAGLQEIQARQAAVAELKQKLDLREELAVAGESERIDAHPEALVEWAKDVSTLKDGRWWALLLAALNLAALVYGFI